MDVAPAKHPEQRVLKLPKISQANATNTDNELTECLK